MIHVMVGWRTSIGGSQGASYPLGPRAQLTLSALLVQHMKYRVLHMPTVA